MQDKLFWIYQFHYEHIKAKYGDRAVLLFTDTASLCYKIETLDLYQDFTQYKSVLDLSNYDNDHPLYDGTNQAVPGFFKNETNRGMQNKYSVLYHLISIIFVTQLRQFIFLCHKSISVTKIASHTHSVTNYYSYTTAKLMSPKIYIFIFSFLQENQ